MIGGDSGVFRAAATRVRGWSDALHSDADRLRTGHDVHWVGTAGDSFRARVAACADQAVGACDDLEAYAAALDDLAGTLDARQERLAALVDAAGATWDEARDAVVHGAGDLVEGAKDLGEDAWHAVTPW